MVELEYVFMECKQQQNELFTQGLLQSLWFNKTKDHDQVALVIDTGFAFSTEAAFNAQLRNVHCVNYDQDQLEQLKARVVTNRKRRLKTFHMSFETYARTVPRQLFRGLYLDTCNTLGTFVRDIQLLLKHHSFVDHAYLQLTLCTRMAFPTKSKRVGQYKLAASYSSWKVDGLPEDVKDTRIVCFYNYVVHDLFYHHGYLLERVMPEDNNLFKAQYKSYMCSLQYFIITPKRKIVTRSCTRSRK